MSSKNHSRLQTRIARLIDTKYGEKYSVLSSIHLDLPTGKASLDIAIYPKMVFNWQVDIEKITEPPLTAIEILAPQQAVSDLHDKFDQTYFPAGVKSCWMVFPRPNSIFILKPNAKTCSYTEGVIRDETTGIEISFEEIFAL
jgi:Uma2 family endonuclease